MKNLKTILCSKYGTVFLLLCTCFYVLFSLKNPIRTSYLEGNGTLRGVIIEKKEDEKKVVLVLQAKEKVLATYYKKEQEVFSPSLGDTVSLNGKFILPSPNTNFYQFNYQNYLKSKKIGITMEVSSYQKEKDNQNIFYEIKNKIVSYFDQFKSKTYLHAFLLGDSSLLEKNVKESYQSNGISHLFAVSGMHVSLFVGILSFFLKKIWKNEKCIFAILSLFLLFYCFLASFSPSIVRGAGSFILSGIKKIKKIPCSSLQILLFLFCVLLIGNPYLIYHTGFQFSFTISFFLILFQKQIEGQNGYFRQLFLLSFVCFCASLPLTMQINFEINLLSPIFNLFFVPFISLLLFPFLLLTCIFPFFDFLLSFLLFLLEHISLFCSEISILKISMRVMPFFFLLLYFLFIFCMLYTFFQKKYSLFVLFWIILTIHHYSSYFDTSTQFLMLDVGQGDAMLLKLPHGQGNILIDTGGYLYETDTTLTDTTLIPVLQSLGVLQIDFLILTHGDADHMKESIPLIKKFPIKKVVFNNDDYNALENELLTLLKEKNIPYYQNIQSITVSKQKIYFLNTRQYGNENDNSNVLYFKINDYSFLLMGDAGVAKEEDILKKYNIKNVTVLKVGHHGSKTSSSKYFIEQINPMYSLLSVGKNNHYGHPEKEVLENLKNTEVKRTDINGSISIQIKNKKLKIKTCIP